MKNNFICVLIMTLFASSCGKDSTNLPAAQPSSQSNSQVQQSKIMQVPSELRDQVNLINQEIVAYTSYVPIDNLIIEYSTDESLNYENEARGVCIKETSPPKIILYRRDWLGSEGIGSFTVGMTEFQKNVSLFHLIGHCIFNKPHNNEMNGAIPKSFMHSNFLQSYYPQGLQNNGLHLQLGDLKREFYNYQGQW